MTNGLPTDIMLGIMYKNSPLFYTLSFENV